MPISDRQFVKLLKEHNLAVQHTNKHSRILNSSGERIYTFSSSPKNAYQAIDNTIKDLINCGHLPHGIVYRGKVYKKNKAQ